MATVNLVCENTRFDGNVETELRAVPVPEGQIVGENYTPPENCDIATGWEQTSFQFAELWNELSVETVNVIGSWIGAIPYLVGYALIILLCMFVWRAVRTFLTPRRDFTSLKTVTFGDESAVRSETAASFISIVLIFILWASFTGSQLLPGFLRMPAPYTGEATFTYVAQDVNGNTDEATVLVNVVPYQSQTETPEIEPGEGIARNDAISIEAYDSELLSWDSNDEVNRREGGRILSVNGQETDFDPNALDDNGRLLQRPPSFDIGFGRAVMNEKGALNIVPDQGWQMKPLYLPSPEGVWTRFLNIAQYGYQNVYLLIQVGFSLFRVIIGFLLGALIGIPLGYAMGLSNWFRGWFDPIVEFMRPVPPLALIPLVIIWFGIGEVGKITLLFLAALWIMAIAARSGVSGVKISKVHAAYSLGASRWQVLRHVIIPNSLPEIFTGARVAMGVCWGTVVAAELVAAEEGVGKMITTASKFQATEIIFLGVILIGIIGFGIDVLMRLAERKLVPWKGRG